MNNKRIITGIICILVIIGGILIIVNTRLGKDARAKIDLRKMTKEFYGYYYEENNKDNDVKNFLKNYLLSGLTISLGDMEVYIEEKSSGGTKYKSLEKCDRAKSKIIIYPEEPFSKNDYKLKFDLVCY